jgi:hypothetical protein
MKDITMQREFSRTDLVESTAQKTETEKMMLK